MYGGAENDSFDVRRRRCENFVVHVFAKNQRELFHRFGLSISQQTRAQFVWHTAPKNVSTRLRTLTADTIDAKNCQTRIGQPVYTTHVRKSLRNVVGKINENRRAHAGLTDAFQPPLPQTQRFNKYAYV